MAKTPELEEVGTFQGRVFWTGIKQDRNGNDRLRVGVEVDTDEGPRSVWGGWPVGGGWGRMLDKVFGENWDTDSIKGAEVRCEVKQNTWSDRGGVELARLEPVSGTGAGGGATGTGTGGGASTGARAPAADPNAGMPF